MKFLIMVLVSMMAATSNAALGAEDLLSLIVKAKSPENVDTLVSQAKEQSVARAECDEQLRSRKLPTSCFEKLEIQSKHGELKSEEVLRQKSWLSEFCLRRAEESSDRLELRGAQAARHLPEACRKKAREREADLLYSLRSSHPEAVL